MEQMQQENAEEDTTSIKGIKAGTQLVLNDGTYDIDSEDDALLIPMEIWLSTEEHIHYRQEMTEYMRMLMQRFPVGT